MQVFRGFQHPGIAPACALTIGNFDGVHRGHQAMLALLRSEAQHRNLPSCVMTFEPHPRDYFARLAGKPELAPARIATLRDKLSELARCGIDQAVVLRFDAAFAAQTPQAFIDNALVRGLGTKYVLVGDDFRFGAKRAGDYAMLDTAGQEAGFDVARMNSYEVRGLRVSSSAVREALASGDMASASALLGRPYSISGHVIHGQKLGRSLGSSGAGASDGFRTLTCASTTPGQRRWASTRCAPTAWARRRSTASPALESGQRWTTAAGCCSKCTACAGPMGSARKGATVDSSPWNCCTNFATKPATTGWRR